MEWMVTRCPVDEGCIARRAVPPRGIERRLTGVCSDPGRSEFVKDLYLAEDVGVHATERAIDVPCRQV